MKSLCEAPKVVSNGHRERRLLPTAAERIAAFERAYETAPMDAITNLLLDGVAALERVRKSNIEYLNPEDALLAKRANRILNVAFRGIAVQVNSYHGPGARGYTVERFVLDSRSTGPHAKVGMVLQEVGMPESWPREVIALEQIRTAGHCNPGSRPAMTMSISPEIAALAWESYINLDAKQVGATAIAPQSIAAQPAVVQPVVGQPAAA